MDRPEDIAYVSGNASEDIKRLLSQTGSFYNDHPIRRSIKGPIFGELITARIVVTEVSVERKVEEPQKLEGRVVCEIIVEQDMINAVGNIHGGCSAFLIDVCSTLALTALSMTTTGDIHGPVSQSLNMVYHSPAGLGDKLRIVNTSLTLGTEAHSARTEIWNLTHHRLVASGVHVKMQASAPRAKF